MDASTNEQLTILSFLSRHAQQRPEAPFIVHLESGKVLTFGETLQTAQKLSIVLSRHGVGKKSRVAFLVRNHWLIYPLLIACCSRKARLVPIDPELHRDELGTVMSHASPSMTITTDSLAEILSEMDSIKDVTEPLLSSEPGDVVLMIYTSGTTGSPKSVMLTEANLATDAVALAERYAITSVDRLYCIMPTHHMNAIMMTGIVPLVGGACVYLSDVFSFKNAKLFWKRVSEFGVTVCSLVPSVMAMMLKLFPNGADANCAQVRFGFCGAAPLPATTWKHFEEVFGFPVYQGYGLTETTCWAVSSPSNEPRRWETVGTPLRGCEVKIDSNGEVLIRGGIVGPGYFKNPKLTADLTTADGFFRTGDLGSFDDEGHLRITGRLKEIIIKNGANIFPGDIDRVISSHPSIRESKTIGIPDEIVGERIYAVCVPEDGSAPKEMELRTWAQARLSHYMWPDVFVVMGYLPSGTSGKITTNTLRKIVTGELSAEILASLNTWKFKRAQPSSPEQTQDAIQRSLIKGEPIRFLSYWGCGRRDSIGAADVQSLDRLQELLSGARRLVQAPPRLTLIFTDVHAKNNRKPWPRVEKYFSEVQAQASRLGMETVMLSAIWKEAELEAANVDASEWEKLPQRDQLIDQARRHAEDGVEPELAAQRYYAGCRIESEAIASLYPSSIFLTYNDPQFDFLLPPLPKLYLSSYKDGTSEKPWFVD